MTEPTQASGVPASIVIVEDSPVEAELLRRVLLAPTPALSRATRKGGGIYSFPRLRGKAGMGAFEKRKNKEQK